MCGLIGVTRHSTQRLMTVVKGLLPSQVAPGRYFLTRQFS